MILKTLIKGSFLALILFMPLSQLSGCAKTPALFEVSVTNGTGSGEYAVGENVTIKANDPEMGKEFSQWSLNGLVIDDLTKPELSFVMPSNDVTATALYKDIAYEITLENCVANKESAKYGEMVTFTAIDYIGKEFSSWNFKGVDTTNLNLNKSPITITMPANDIVVAAVLEDIDYTISVEGGTADKTTAHYGESVTITVNEEIPGRKFVSWSILEGLDSTNLDLTKPELTFIMPACNVYLKALYDFINYNVTIIGGTAQIDDFEEPKTNLLAGYGTIVNIFANESVDKRFIKWTCDNEEVVFNDATSATTQFSMPASDVNIVAEFEQLYQITVDIGCTTNKQFAAEGEEVTVTKPIAKEGYATRWVVEGLDVDWPARQNEVTFTMPANDVKVGYQKVRLQFIFTINGGTATGTKALSPNSVTDNETGFDYNCDVTITANVPTGKKFVKWTIEGVDTSALDLSQSTLSFKMPANSVTVTANFKFINHTITIEGGTADKLTAHYGDSVKITAIIPEDKEFVMWEFEGLVADTLDITQKELTFRMPNNNVTVTAVFENKPTRLTFVSNVAESGRLSYLNNESKKFLVSMGTLGTLPVKYTFEIVGTGATELSVFDQNGTEVTLVENTITLEKSKEDYVVILTYLGMKATSFNLKITETVVSS